MNEYFPDDTPSEVMIIINGIIGFFKRLFGYK